MLYGRAYLIAADDYESMAETDYLLRSPANAARLTSAADEVRHGRSLLTKTMDELQGMADEDE
jgi:antitoxin YefM